MQREPFSKLMKLLFNSNQSLFTNKQVVLHETEYPVTIFYLTYTLSPLLEFHTFHNPHQSSEK